MHRRFFVSLMMLFLSVCGKSQNVEDDSPARDALDDMFEYLEKDRVPTGLLRDFAIELLDLDQYDGLTVTDSNSVSFPTFVNILRSVRSSALGEKPFEPVSEILLDLAEQQVGSTIPIGVVLYKYSYIRQNALSAGYLQFINNKVYDRYNAAGIWLNPYSQKYVFGFSPYENIHYGNVVTFSFASLFFTNLNIRQIEFDDGSGNGYQTISQDDTWTVSYPISDKYELKLRVTLNDGIQLVSHSTINIVTERDQLFSYDLLPIVDTVTCSVPYNGSCPKAYVRYLYADGHSGLEKPLIVVEGCDPKCFWNEGQYGNTSLDTFVASLPESITGTYDIVYVEWDDSNTYIQANGNLLIDVLELINQDKAPGSERNILLAQSMGGLVARYALKTMENAQREHEVSLFISHDVPYLGANLPLGVQYAVRDIVNIFGIDALSLWGNLKIFSNNENASSSIITDALDFFNSPAARQMLTYYLNDNYVLDNSVHQDFLDEMLVLGWPEGDSGFAMNRFAISNGALQSFASVPHLLQLEADASFGGISYLLATWMLGININDYLSDSEFLQEIASWFKRVGTSTISAEMTISPFVYLYGPLYQLDVNYNKRFLWITNYTGSLCSKSFVPPNCVPLDAVGGSYLGYGVHDSSGPQDFLNIFRYSYSLDIAPKFMFVPTASSLCVGCGRLPLTSNVYNCDYSNPSTYISQTPFNSIFTPEESEFHISFNETNMSWLESVMATELMGPDIGTTGTQYVVGGPYGQNVLWTSSNPSVATINSSGVLTVLSHGWVTLYASCGAVQLSKTICANLPDFTLTLSTSRYNGMLNARVNCLDPSFTNIFANQNNVEYEWGLKVGNGPIDWSVSPPFGSKMYTWSSDGTSTVYFRARCGAIVGSTYSQTVPAWHEFLPYEPIFIGGDGTLYCDNPESDGYSPVKGPVTEEESSWTFSIDGNIRIHFDYEPNSFQLISELLRIQKFAAILASVKPWGQDDIKVIKFRAVDDISGITYESVLKFVFKEDLYEK